MRGSCGRTSRRHLARRAPVGNGASRRRGVLVPPPAPGRSGGERGARDHHARRGGRSAPAALAAGRAGRRAGSDAGAVGRRVLDDAAPGRRAPRLAPSAGRAGAAPGREGGSCADGRASGRARIDGRGEAGADRRARGGGARIDGRGSTGAGRRRGGARRCRAPVRSRRGARPRALRDAAAGRPGAGRTACLARSRDGRPALGGPDDARFAAMAKRLGRPPGPPMRAAGDCARRPGG